MDNRLKLHARVASREALRYTPAGVAVLTFVAAHRSSQPEAGRPREVMLDLDCIALGDKAQALEQLPVDTDVALSGFLSNKSSKSRWVVFHVTEFDLK